MKLLTSCPHMIPAERCMVVIAPSLIERERMIHPTGVSVAPLSFTMRPLEGHGLDEIECGWHGELEVEGCETPTDWWARGDCPRCGQEIQLRGTD